MIDKDRFFGLHFDLHANTNSKIGDRTNAEDIEWYIKESGIDFIQCDCKGHPGISSYSTKAGNACPTIIKDNLKIWCDTAHKNNIPIYMHYSGVADVEYVKNNPDDAMWEDENNNYITEYAGRDTCVYGPYADKLMIPQLKDMLQSVYLTRSSIFQFCIWGIFAYSKSFRRLLRGYSRYYHRQSDLRLSKHYTLQLQ